ncbi:hypothetical protein [Roseateles asaccharophilus]|uniref:hypothetical protein n=1 Tax=Roseateles asaccharophilus TaxID=582607 RepID=UPI00384BBFC6
MSLWFVFGGLAVQMLISALAPNPALEFAVVALGCGLGHPTVTFWIASQIDRLLSR